MKMHQSLMIVVVFEAMLPENHVGYDFVSIWDDFNGPRCPKMRKKFVDAYLLWIPAAKWLLK
ncbi:hypothetical protein OROGR_000128 [Orobanche gracilis]